MLQVIASEEDQFGSERVQQAQQQQPAVADLQAGLLSGKLFQQFLSQHCGPNSGMTQICCHQAFAQAMSGMIRLTKAQSECHKLCCCSNRGLHVHLWHLP